jgi:uroporphyrinogen-III synthase
VSRPIAVLRPEPGNRVTAAAIEAAGRRAIRLPLFAVAPLAWEPPDPARFDALIATSANVFRHGGPGLDALRDLPVHAVGEVTAEAARRAGFVVAATGMLGSAELIANSRTMGVRHALHLAGRERTIEADEIVAAIVTVYASDPLPIDAEAAARLAGSVALVQSRRAALRLGEIVADRAPIVLVTVSPAVAGAAGSGWERVVTFAAPDGAALIDAALALAD